MITGKRSHCVNQANECTFTFSSPVGEMNVELRAYNDGLTFRYVDADGKANVVDENTSYIIPDGVNRWEQPYDQNGYEDFYENRTDGAAIYNRKGTINQWGYPMLLKSDSETYTLITEANVTRGLCSSLLNNQVRGNEYKVVRGYIRFHKVMKAASPWRVVMLGSLGDIVESTLVTDVSDPNCLGNTDWVKLGVASWVYWAYNHGSNDYKIVKPFIDLAAKMHWPYVLIDEGWDLMKNGGNVEDAIKYAKKIGVKPMLWCNSLTSWIGPDAPGLDRDISKKEFREKEFAWLAGLGMAGIKVDFFNGDGRDFINYYHDLMECAAKSHLLINFHGATVPRGWSRTYPNLMSTEAVYGQNIITIIRFLPTVPHGIMPYYLLHVM